MGVTNPPEPNHRIRPGWTVSGWLILGALKYAIWTRDVRDGQAIHHSDRGSNYTSSRSPSRAATT
jgi:hypothetical protein